MWLTHKLDQSAAILRQARVPEALDVPFTLNSSSSIATVGAYRPSQTTDQEFACRGYQVRIAGHEAPRGGRGFQRLARPPALS